MPTILRVVEDYYPDPNDTEPKLKKRNLVLKLAPPKNGWVLVKGIIDSGDLPTWIPERIVTKAQPGFYRTLAKLSTRSERVPDSMKKHVHEGEIVEVTSMGRWNPFAQIPDGSWEAKKLDGSQQRVFIDPQSLEPVDDLIQSPATLAQGISTSSQASSSASRDDGSHLPIVSPPPYLQEGEEKPNEKATAA